MRHLKVLSAMEKLSNSDQQPFKVYVDKPGREWHICFKTQTISLTVTLEDFINMPMKTYELFCEKLIKGE